MIMERICGVYSDENSFVLYCNQNYNFSLKGIVEMGATEKTYLTPSATGYM